MNFLIRYIHVDENVIYIYLSQWDSEQIESLDMHHSFINYLFLLFNRNKPVLKHLNEVSRSMKKNVHNKFWNLRAKNKIKGKTERKRRKGKGAHVTDHASTSKETHTLSLSPPAILFKSLNRAPPWWERQNTSTPSLWVTTRSLNQKRRERDNIKEEARSKSLPSNAREESSAAGKRPHHSISSRLSSPLSSVPSLPFKSLRSVPRRRPAEQDPRASRLVDHLIGSPPAPGSLPLRASDIHLVYAAVHGHRVLRRWSHH